MTPDHTAALLPDKPAAVLGQEVLSFAALSDRSLRLAAAMASAGLRSRHHVALLLENRLDYFVVAWAAHRLGLYYTPVNWHLQADEVAHILADSGARWVFVSQALAPLVKATRSDALERVVIVDEPSPSALSRLIDQADPHQLLDQREGQAMFYSSGTTGQPKGIKRSLAMTTYGTSPAWESLITDAYDVDAETVYLCPAPLYHAAPLGWTMAVQRRGGTVILMERFDPLEALRLIEQHRVTHVQMVPTHFVQLLKLPASQRSRFDLSSLRVAVHAAAPCPVDVKEQMMAWWGPIIHEYYAYSEGSGFARIGPQEWLTHKGSVGRAALGTFRILDEHGVEQPPGVTGQVWIEGGQDFAYHNDPDKTAAAHDATGRSSVGDVGHLDAEGYLYLTDRISHMIISGGVNIYPQEVENLLVMHPAVADVAVIGVPDAHYGERVLAVVVPAADVQPDVALAQALIDYSRARIAHFKCPKTVEFVERLPRLPSGKLIKRQLRDQYRNTHATTGPAEPKEAP